MVLKHALEFFLVKQENIAIKEGQSLDELNRSIKDDRGKFLCFFLVQTKIAVRLIGIFIFRRRPIFFYAAPKQFDRKFSFTILGIVYDCYGCWIIKITLG